MAEKITPRSEDYSRWYLDVIRDAELAESSLRLSLGRFTRLEDIDRAAAAIQREVARLRALAP